MLPHSSSDIQKVSVQHPDISVSSPDDKGTTRLQARENHLINPLLEGRWAGAKWLLGRANVFLHSV